MSLVDHRLFYLGDPVIVESCLLNKSALFLPVDGNRCCIK